MRATTIVFRLFPLSNSSNESVISDESSLLSSIGLFPQTFIAADLFACACAGFLTSAPAVPAETGDAEPRPLRRRLQRDSDAPETDFPFLSLSVSLYLSLSLSLYCGVGGGDRRKETDC